MEAATLPPSRKDILTPARFLACLVLLTACAHLFAGFLASPSLGDEVHHYRFAKDNYILGGRAVFDAVYGSSKAPGFFYESEIAWPLGLAILWKLTGGISFPVAQFYHFCYSLLLIAAVFLLARKMYGGRAAAWAALITATLPMAVSFGILFYIDVPGTALAVLTFLLLAEKRYFVAGLVFGLQFLTKKSAVFFIPAIFLWILVQHWRRPLDLIRAILLTAVPAGMLIYPDLLWRKAHLVASISTGAWIQQRMAAAVTVMQTPAVIVVPDFLARIQDFTNSSLGNPQDLFKYFGVALWAGLAAYFIRRKYEHKDLLLWAAIVGFVFAAWLLKLFPDIRYVMPVAPFLAILASKALARAERFNFFSGLIVLICVGQLLAAAVYTAYERKIPQAIREGFEYISNEVPQDAVILYPETNLLEFTGRRMVWTRMNLRYFFWGTEDQKKTEIRTVGLDYIAIKKKRVYDDVAAGVFHVGQYPESFLAFLEVWPQVTVVFENEALRIYKVNHESLT